MQSPMQDLGSLMKVKHLNLPSSGPDPGRKIPISCGLFHVLDGGWEDTFACILCSANPRVVHFLPGILISSRVIRMHNTTLER